MKIFHWNIIEENLTPPTQKTYFDTMNRDAYIPSCNNHPLVPFPLYLWIFLISFSSAFFVNVFYLNSFVCDIFLKRSIFFSNLNSTKEFYIYYFVNLIFYIFCVFCFILKIYITKKFCFKFFVFFDVLNLVLEQMSRY